MFAKKRLSLSVGLFLILFSRVLCFSGANEYFSIPRPTGCFSVGTKLFYETDRDRIDSETGRNRQLVIQIWYPSEGELGEPTAHYAYEALKVLKADLVEAGYDPDVIAEQFEFMRTYAILDAQLSHAKSMYPVIIFGHGYGTPRGFYSSLCEELASQGYIVCMVMHTYAAGLTRFADGTESEYMRERGPELVSDCIADIECMLNRMQAGAFGELSQCGDCNNVGMVGHSMGGMLASVLCGMDKRIQAGISLDGPLVKSMERPTHKPFMFMIAPTFHAMFDGETSLLSTNLDSFLQANQADSYKIILKGAEHNTFSDMPVWSTFLRKILCEDDIPVGVGTIDEAKALEICRAYVGGFFDKYLQGKANQLFDKGNITYVTDTEVLPFPIENPKLLPIFSPKLVDRDHLKPLCISQRARP